MATFLVSRFEKFKTIQVPKLESEWKENKAFVIAKFSKIVAQIIAKQKYSTPSPMCHLVTMAWTTNPHPTVT